MLLALEGLNTRIACEECPEIFLGALLKVLGTWPSSVQEDGLSLGPQIRVRHPPSGYLISSPWLSEAIEEKTETGAVFSVTAEIGRAFAEEHPEVLCLHSAAVN